MAVKLASLMDKDPNLEKLGMRIRERRKVCGFSQEELAHESAIDRSYIGGVERGERNVTFTMLCRIAATLKTDAGQLTEGLPIKRA